LVMLFYDGFLDCLSPPSGPMGVSKMEITTERGHRTRQENR